MSKCDVTLEDLDSGCPFDNNMSGVTTIYICPKRDVTKINAIPPAQKVSMQDFVTIGNESMNGKAVEVKTGKGFVKIEIPVDTGELKYNIQGPATGNRSIKAHLEIFKSAFKTKELAFMSVMMNQEFIVCALMNNDKYHLLGDLKRGAQFADGTEATSGKTVTDNNGETFIIEWDTPAPRIFYDGWTPDDEVKGLPMLANAALP